MTHCINCNSILAKYEGEVCNACLNDKIVVRREYQKYRKAYDILMEYWDCLPEEEKPEIGRQFDEIGL